jgi:hypothetical protein
MTTFSIYIVPLLVLAFAAGSSRAVGISAELANDIVNTHNAYVYFNFQILLMYFRSRVLFL